MAQKSENYEQRIQTGCLLILTALGISGALYALRSVLIPFVLAVFLTLCLIPAIDVQMKWLRIPRRTAISSELCATVHPARSFWVGLRTRFSRMLFSNRAVRIMAWSERGRRPFVS